MKSLYKFFTVASTGLILAAVSCTPDDQVVNINPAPSCAEYSECNVSSTCSRPQDADINNILKSLQNSESFGKTAVEVYLNGCFNSNTHFQYKTNYIEGYISEWTSEIDPASTEPNTLLDTLYSSLVVVHEIHHALAEVLSGPEAECCEGDVQMSFFLEEGNTVIVPYTRSVSSQLLISLIPDEIKDINFNYHPYIGEGGHTSVVSGIYALVEEYHAYYQDGKTAYGYYNYLLQLYNSTGDENYLKVITSTFRSSIISFYEFKYFTYLYMEYVKNSHPEIYEETISNDAFMEAFSFVDENYLQLKNQMVYIINNEPVLSPHLDSYEQIQWYLDFVEAEINKISWKD